MQTSRITRARVSNTTVRRHFYFDCLYAFARNLTLVQLVVSAPIVFILFFFLHGSQGPSTSHPLGLYIYLHENICISHHRHHYHLHHIPVLQLPSRVDTSIRNGNVFVMQMQKVVIIIVMVFFFFFISQPLLPRSVYTHARQTSIPFRVTRLKMPPTTIALYPYTIRIQYNTHTWRHVSLVWYTKTYEWVYTLRTRAKE